MISLNVSIVRRLGCYPVILWLAVMLPTGISLADENVSVNGTAVVDRATTELKLRVVISNEWRQIAVIFPELFGVRLKSMHVNTQDFYLRAKHDLPSPEDGILTSKNDLRLADWYHDRTSNTMHIWPTQHGHVGQDTVDLNLQVLKRLSASDVQLGIMVSPSTQPVTGTDDNIPVQVRLPVVR